MTEQGTSASKREPGFYRVKLNGNWIVIECEYGGLWAWSVEDGGAQRAMDYDFQEIDERRIERPPQQPAPEPQLTEEDKQRISEWSEKMNAVYKEPGKVAAYQRGAFDATLHERAAAQKQPDTKLSEARKKIAELQNRVAWLEQKIKDREEWTDNWG